jgi:serine/threonine-protein kinase
MASVHAARLVGAEGFSRLVAAKRLHPHFSDDPDFVAMFHDEARIASRIHHLNVVPVLDVVRTERDTVLVQEYVHGVPLSYLMKVANTTSTPVPVGIAVAIIAGVLSGLHAAHEARDELGEPLGIIHRDVSPQNIMVSVDGVPRLLDFGIAKARTSAHHTREGIFKGKLAYVAPEQIRLEPLTRTVDIYAVGVVMWELLTNRRFNEGKADAEFVASLVDGSIPSIADARSPSRRTMSDVQWTKLLALSSVVARARELLGDSRFATAADMLAAVLAAHEPAPQRDVAEWVKATAGQYLERQQKELALNEENWRSLSHVSAAGSLSTPWRPSVEPTLAADSEASRKAPSSLSPFERAENLAASKGITSPIAIVAAAGLLLALIFGVLVGTGQPPTPPVVAITPEETTSKAQLDVASLPPVVSPSAPATPSTAAMASSSAPTAFAPVVSVAPVRATTPPWRPPPPRSPAAGVTAPTSTGAVAPAPTPAIDCNPPFYFDGAKKVFKRSCL